jgi:hypothetical protein
VIVTFFELDTFCVVIVNVALVEPAVTVTVGGTVATEVSPVERLTEVFADGAAVSVTVPWEVSPPLTLVGLRLNEATLTLPEPWGVTESVALSVVPPYDAEIVAVCVVVTALVVIGNVAMVDPAGTLTLAGTAATAALLESVTAAPPGGAPLSVTVPCEAVPPMTLAGFIVKPATVMAVGAVM